MAAVIAAVLALLATPTSNAVAVAPGESFPGYAYDGTRASEPFDDTAAERGPPGPNDRAMTYDAVDRWSHGASASPDIATPGPTRTYTAPGGPPQVVEAAGKTQAGARADVGGLSSLARAGVAANGAGKIPWTSWQNYPKVTQGGREYAQVGDRLYTRHAVDRMQPSGLGAPAGASGPGRSISPNYIEDVLGSTKGSPVKGPNGEARLSYTSGTVQVITENNIVITVITR